MSNFVCQAQEYAGRMWCGRCGTSWDVKSEADIGGACKPKADPPIGFAEMETTVRGQALAIIASQHAAVKAGFRGDPYLPELRKAAVLMAVAVILERVRGDERIMALLKGRKS
jgi:hypothetical protein